MGALTMTPKEGNSVLLPFACFLIQPTDMFDKPRPLSKLLVFLRLTRVIPFDEAEERQRREFLADTKVALGVVDSLVLGRKLDVLMVEEASHIFVVKKAVRDGDRVLGVGDLLVLELHFGQSENRKQEVVIFFLLLL